IGNKIKGVRVLRRKLILKDYFSNRSQKPPKEIKGLQKVFKPKTVGACECFRPLPDHIKQTPLQLPTPHLAIVPHRLQPFETFMLDDGTGEVTNLASFTSAAAALMHHDAMVRGALREE